MVSKTVLITGCSTGIGRNLARRLSASDYTVIATARNPESLSDLPVALRLPLDVTDSESVANATEEAISRFGRIDALVNNAGYGIRGAVEEVSAGQVQKMFDVNVFGVMRMVSAVAPHMRRQGEGRIITIGSIAGKLVLPANGTYSASKFAVEALSDAMRMELAPFGIRVVLVQPGNIKSQFAATAHTKGEEFTADPSSPYKSLYERYFRVMTSMRRNEAPPGAVSRVVQRAIEAPNPRARYYAAVPPSNQLMLHLGDRARDLILKRMFGTGSVVSGKGKPGE